MRRLLLAALVLLAVLLAVNTVVTDSQTKAAKADIGRILDLPGGDLQVREDGTREATPIVMLHGFAGSMHWWTPLVERLGRDFRLIRIDLLGHGGSEKPGQGYSIGHQADQVAAALSALRVENAVIVGHSMGGAVAIALGERNPIFVNSIVLIGTAPDPESSDLSFTAKLAYVPVIGETIRRIAPDTVVRSGYEDAFAEGFDVPDQFVEDFRRMTYTSYDESHDSSDDFANERPLHERLKSLGKRALVIYGSEDRLVEPKAIEKYATDIRIALETLPESGHSPMFEQPGETARLFRTFVRSLGLE